MMIEWDDDTLGALVKKADLVVWGYEGHPDEVDHHFSTRHVERFSKLKVPMWAAGAYKGANGMSSDLPEIDSRLFNARAWLELDERFWFCGLIATAWSRWSTYRMQNEPIDAALDAMILVGHLFAHGRMCKDAEAVLRNVGEFDRWQDCYNALNALTQARNQAWTEVRQILEVASVADVAPHRRGCGSIEANLDVLDKNIKTLEAKADVVRNVLTGLVADCWIDEYLYTRLQPLRDELARLRGNIHVLRDAD